MHVKGSPHVVSFSADSTRVTAIGDSRHLDVRDPTVDSAPFFVGLDISFRWLPGTHTAVYGGSDGQAALHDTDAGGPTRRQPAVHADTGAGDVHIATFNGKARALPRATASSARPTMERLPARPGRLARRRLLIVRRDLTRTEWAAYLPNRAYQPSCGMIGRA